MGSFVADLGTEHAREEAVRRGLAAAPHRGSTREVVRRGRACLGVSVHPELHDAWVAGDGGLVAAVTGDLDEAELLVSRSEREGHPVVDPTNPASVVCAAWRAWGEDTPTRLRGTYAIAVSDGDRLWVFRDHVGYRAAFYRRDAGGLTAASEAKQVVATSGIPPEPDLDVLERIYLAEDATAMFEEAERQGYRHLLGGFGAELVIDMRHSLIAHLLVTGRVGAASRLLRAQLRKGARPAAVAKQIVAVAAPRDAYAWFRGRVSLRRGGRVPPWLDETRVHRRAVEHTVAPRHRWRREQPVGFTGPGLTVEANEIVQEIYGVRMRRPWLDVDVWELFLSLPAEQKHPDATVKG